MWIDDECSDIFFDDLLTQVFSNMDLDMLILMLRSEDVELLTLPQKCRLTYTLRSYYSKILLLTIYEKLSEEIDVFLSIEHESFILREKVAYIKIIYYIV